MTYCVAALHKLAPLVDYKDLREPLQDMCYLLSIQGTVLLASEGINGTIAGADEAVEKLLKFQCDSRRKHD